MGTTDVGTRNFVRRPAPVPPRRPEKAAAAPAINAAVESVTHVKTTVTTESSRATTAATAVQVKKPTQEEFGFQGEPVENRGTFGKSDRNLFEGQDLDVPTYLRKGIKVAP
jgi:cell division protein FtsZ